MTPLTHKISHSQSRAGDSLHAVSHSAHANKGIVRSHPHRYWDCIIIEKEADSDVVEKEYENDFAPTIFEMPDFSHGYKNNSPIWQG